MYCLDEDEMLESERALQAARAKQQEALIKAAQQYNLKKEQQVHCGFITLQVNNDISR